MLKEASVISNLFRPNVETENFEAIPLAENQERGQFLAQRESKIVDKWVSELNNIIDLTIQENSFDEKYIEALKKSIQEWAAHKDHGARHSYYVYQGMIWLAQQEGQWNPADDSKFQALAVLHDLGQTIPFINPVTNEKIVNANQRKGHGKFMALAIKKFGKGLGVDDQTVEELSYAINHHDDVYFNKHFSSPSLAGQFLADADKLFGAGLSRDPADLSKDAIKRNLEGANKEGGWLVFRDDLTSEIRDGWQYGDRWLSDAVSAVSKDIFSIEFFTETGKKVAAARAETFLNQAQVVYGNLYDQNALALKFWHKTLNAGKPIKIFLVGQDKKRTEIDGIHHIDSVVYAAYNRTLSLEEKYLRGNFVPKGWKLIVQIKAGEFLIDPSIARFALRDRGGKEVFLQKLKNAFVEK